MTTPALESFTRAREGLLTRGGNHAGMGRSASWTHFVAAGLPHAKTEAWRYTPTKGLWARSFEPAPKVTEKALKVPPPLPGAARIAFVNGRFEPLLAVAPPSGAQIARVQSALAAFPMESPEEVALFALNRALFEEAAVIELGDGVDGGTLEVLHLMHGAVEGTMAHPRINVRLGAGARLKLVETYLSHETGAYFVNSATEAILGAGAVLDHVVLQEEGPRGAHVGGIQVRQGAKSRFTSHVLQLGGALCRRELSVQLADEGAEVALSGLFVPQGDQHHDHYVRIDHQAPGCTSRQLFRGIMRDKSRGVFVGRVWVHPHAQKTDADQSARALLLSPDCEVDLKPHLEIRADDVKASHGTTVGSLDAEQVFYLRSRGIPEEEARALLIRAFAQAVLDKVTIPGVREREEALLGARLEEAR